jgi:hypothetical protein
MLYRCHPLDPRARPTDEGGSLHVPRPLQGGGRHDNPDRYGALYTSRSPASVIAEVLRYLRRHTVTEIDLSSDGRPLVLAALDESRLDDLVDLDDPRTLVVRDLRPSRVATGNRRPTRHMALALYDEGIVGFEWWSTIEASWINVTLFEDRAVERLSVVSDPEPLTLDHPAVREAAEAVGVLLAS